MPALWLMSNSWTGASLAYKAKKVCRHPIYFCLRPTSMHTHRRTHIHTMPIHARTHTNTHTHIQCTDTHTHTKPINALTHTNTHTHIYNAHTHTHTHTTGKLFCVTQVQYLSTLKRVGYSFLTHHYAALGLLISHLDDVIVGYLSLCLCLFIHC